MRMARWLAYTACSYFRLLLCACCSLRYRGRMTREEIENAVALILINDGPDGHVDGADVIANFILALLDGTGPDWIESYGKRARKQLD